MKIRKIISSEVSIGLQHFADDYNCKILYINGLSEYYVEIEIEGDLEDLKQLNQKAVNYKPMEIRVSH